MPLNIGYRLNFLQKSTAICTVTALSTHGNRTQIPVKKCTLRALPPLGTLQVFNEDEALSCISNPGTYSRRYDRTVRGIKTAVHPEPVQVKIYHQCVTSAIQGLPGPQRCLVSLPKPSAGRLLALRAGDSSRICKVADRMRVRPLCVCSLRSRFARQATSWTAPLRPPDQASRHACAAG